MAEKESGSFGALLGRYRAAVGLSQEELAERAGLSVRGVSDLERGARTRPYGATVRQLADALGLSADDRAVLLEAAHHARRPGTHPAASASVPGNFLGALPPGPLVGREEELSRIQSALHAVAEGRGQLLLVVGELGVGKTRLAQEATVRIRDADGAPAKPVHFLLGTGRCYQRDQQRPYAPLFQALSEVMGTGPAGVRGEIERRWQRARQELDAVLANGATGGDTHHDLAVAVTDFVTALADIAPVAIVLDDLHWADDATISLLQRLAQETRAKPVFLLATLRDSRLSEEHPVLAHTVHDLARERLAERIVVRRLSAEETAHLAASTMGQASLADDIAAFIYRRTKGIPRFIEGMIQALGGRLELHGEIGAGAMGRVFAAYDAQTERQVAAKLMLIRSEVDLDTVLRFQHEAAVLARLRHPCVVEIYDSFIDEHASCLIMERLDGHSLGHILQNGALPLPRAKALARQVAEALAYAHSQEIVHRDIKPDNVMVLKGDQIKVTDFGIARILQPDTSLQTMATTGMRMGTPLYMAPEQIEGKKVDVRTDIYALGAMLYHMITGRPPFEGGDALAVAIKHLQEDPVPPSRIDSAIPPAWDALILKAMAKDPKARFQSAREMRQAIASLTEERSAETTQVTRSWYWLAAAGGVIAALLVAAVGVWSHVAVSSGRAAEAANVDTYLSGLAQQHEFSGVALVARRGRTVLSKGYGFADRENRIRNTPQTVYPIGGLGYAISYQLALQLAEAGKLSLSRPICAYLSHCPAAWRSISIEMVVDGTARLPDYPWGGVPTAAEDNVRFCEALPLDTVPAGATDYGKSCGVIVLDTVIERALHGTWASLLRQLVLSRADMAHSGRLFDSLHPPARARDYSGSRPGAPEEGSSGTGAIFNLFSTTSDILRYDDALFSERLVSRAGLRRILTPRDRAVPPDPVISGARNGWAWRIGTFLGRRVVYTEGNLSNFYCFNLRLPHEGLTVVLLSNDRQNDTSQIGVNVAAFALGSKPVLPGPPLPARAVDANVAIQATIDARVQGVSPATLPGSLWLVNHIGTLTRIDTRTNAYASSFGVAQYDPSCPGCGVGGPPITADGELWSSDGSHLVRIDPHTDRVVERIPVPSGVTPQAIIGHTLWGTNGARIVRIDLRRRRVVSTVSGFTSSAAIVADRHGVWATDQWTETVKRVDPTTNRIVADIHVGEDPEALALGFGSLWVMNGTGGIISRVDPQTNKVIATIVVGHGVRNTYSTLWGPAVVTAFGRVWTVVHDDQKLVSIDPHTNKPTAELTLPVPPNEKAIEPFNLAVGDGSVWVYADPHYVFRINPRTIR